MTKNVNPFQMDKKNQLAGDGVKDFRPIPQQAESPPDLADVEILQEELTPSSDLIPLSDQSDTSLDQPVVSPTTETIAPASPMSPEQSP